MIVIAKDGCVDARSDKSDTAVVAGLLFDAVLDVADHPE